MGRRFTQINADFIFAKDLKTKDLMGRGLTRMNRNKNKANFRHFRHFEF